jgi:hypothetical protein
MRTVDKIKTIIYNHIVNTSEFNFSFFGGEFKSHLLKVKEGKEKLNSLLDNIDIRSISIILENNPQIKVPKWVKLKQYVIDYNRSNQLDFIRINKECTCF